MDNSLDTRQLQAFVAVSRSGSMTEAARTLFLTPSAVSHAIRELEERVQCRLLDRRSKRLELTMAGEQLLTDAKQILTQMASATASLERLGKWGQERIRIAASEPFCELILPGILKHFYDRYPTSQVTTQVADTFEALESLQKGVVDLGFGLQPPQPFNDDFTPLFDDELALCVSAHHRWSDGLPVDPTRVPGEPFLGYARDTLLAMHIENYFSARNVALNYSMEIDHIGLIKEAIAQNLGVGMLPRWTIEKEVADRKLATPPLTVAALRLTWGCISPAGRQLTLALEMFLNDARTFARHLGAAARNQ